MANRTRAKSRRSMMKRGKAKSRVWELGLFRVSNEEVYRSALDVADSIALVVAEMKAELDEAEVEE